jgi:hypothetical protein
MKLLLAIAAIAAFSNFAHAFPDNDHLSYNITVSSGSGRGFNDSVTCTGEDGYISSGTTCPKGDFRMGYTPNGNACCISPFSAPRSRNSIGNSLENVTDTYWGYISTTARSPNAGRAQSAIARLDVCMGSNDTDAAIATNNATTCYNQYCGTSYNEYCNGNSAAVCQDRCECAILGTTNSACNQL